MIGDSNVDIEAGLAAGCKTALISENSNDFGQTERVSSLYEFVINLI